MITEEMIHEAARRLPGHPEFAYDCDGEVAGLAHYDEATRRWYAVDLEACQALAEMTLTSDDFGGDLGDSRRYRATNVYSRWCSLPEAQPSGEGKTADEAIAAAGWSSSDG